MTSCLVTFDSLIQSLKVLNCRRLLQLILALLVIHSYSACAASDEFLDIFQRHSSVMLLIAPESGKIVKANDAARQFYGYSAEQFNKLSIQDINLLSAEQVAQERKSAEQQQRQYFIFRHKTASGEVKTVQVFSAPIDFNGETVLYSVIQDISQERQLKEELWHYQASLEQLVDQQLIKIAQKSTLISRLQFTGIVVLLLISAVLLYLLQRKRHAEDKHYQLSQIVEQSPIAIATTDLSGKMNYVNQKLIKDSGYSKQELLGFQPSYLSGKAIEKQLSQQLRATLAQGNSWSGEFCQLTKSGEKRWKRGHLYPIKNAYGELVNYAVIKEDITQLKDDEKQLRLASTVFQTATEGVMITNAENNIVAVNDAFTDITGYGQDEVIGVNPGILSSGHHDAEFYQQMQHDLLEHGQWQGEICNRRKDGEVYYEWLSITAIKDEQGQPEGYVSLFSDITKRKKNADKIYRQANYDALTGLANRHLFIDRFTQMLELADRNKQNIALFFIDLDGFKSVNDTLGHAVGDLLLQQVALRLSQAVRKSDTVSRLGGDEFAIVLAENNNLAAVERIANNIKASIAAPFTLKQHQATISASIGIAIYPEHGATSEELLNNADSAMYYAKEHGRNGYKIYQAS